MTLRGACRALLLSASLVGAACARPARTIEPAPGPDAPPRAAARSVRVAIAAGVRQVEVSSPTGFDAGVTRRVPLMRVAPGARARFTVARDQIQAADVGQWDGPRPGEALVITPRGAGHIVVGGRSYRGEVRLIPTDSGVLAVNELPVEEYLRGVVPLEIGPRRIDEQAAVEAQAVAARSFTYVRLRDPATRAWDLRATVADQVYGGVAAERPESDAAIDATRDLVLTFAGRVVDAPYSSACGGETTANDEAYRAAPLPYLRRVSDRRSATSDSSWCDIAPGYRWQRSIREDSLRRGLDRHLRSYVPDAGTPVGVLADIRVTERTEVGRVIAIEIATRAGARWTVRRNDIRFVLRTDGGAIVPSTYLTLAAERRADGALSRLVITGRGNGHGVGMCQWGAIARARAGQSARTILATYYPGTELRRAD